MTPKEGHDLLQRHATQLSEFFGSVQIVASQLQPDGTTVGFHVGRGDLYARIALCDEFVDMSKNDNQTEPYQEEEDK